jgi:hypothetical protein
VREGLERVQMVGNKIQKITYKLINDIVIILAKQFPLALFMSIALTREEKRREEKELDVDVFYIRGRRIRRRRKEVCLL